MGDETKKVFKTRAFGGFDKNDVLNYIEAAARKSKEDVDGLKKEIEEKGKEKEELAAQNARLQEQAASFEQDIAQKEESIASLKEELQKANDTISELRREIAQYDKMKADIAGIELAARRRAKEIERESLKTLEKMRLEADELLKTAKARVSGFVESLGDQVSQAETTLESAKNGYKSLLAGLAGLKEKLYGLEPEEEQDLKTQSDMEPEAPLPESADEAPGETPDEEKNTDELFRSYIEEVSGGAKHLSLKELMDRLRSK